MSTLHYEAIPIPGGYAAAYRIPGTNVYSLVADCALQVSAERVARELNGQAARRDEAVQPGSKWSGAMRQQSLF